MYRKLNIKNIGLCALLSMTMITMLHQGFAAKPNNIGKKIQSAFQEMTAEEKLFVVYLTDFSKTGSPVFRGISGRDLDFEMPPVVEASLPIGSFEHTKLADVGYKLDSLEREGMPFLHGPSGKLVFVDDRQEFVMVDGHDVPFTYLDFMPISGKTTLEFSGLKMAAGEYAGSAEELHKFYKRMSNQDVVDAKEAQEIAKKHLAAHQTANDVRTATVEGLHNISDLFEGDRNGARGVMTPIAAIQAASVHLHKLQDKQVDFLTQNGRPRDNSAYQELLLNHLLPDMHAHFGTYQDRLRAFGRPKARKSD